MVVNAEEPKKCRPYRIKLMRITFRKDCLFQRTGSACVVLRERCGQT